MDTRIGVDVDVGGGLRLAQTAGEGRESLVHFNALSRIGLRLKQGIGAFAYGADCSNISGGNADGSSIPGGG